MQPADTRPMTRRETAVERFVHARYGLRGTLALHRHALGLDLLRAPVNVALSPLFLLVRLGAPVLRWVGLARAADWLAAMNCSAVAEKPLRTASGGVCGIVLDVSVLRADKAAPAPSCGVRIFFMASPMDGLEKQ